jgi:hypothetical protein
MLHELWYNDTTLLLRLRILLRLLFPFLCQLLLQAV